MRRRHGAPFFFSSVRILPRDTFFLVAALVLPRLVSANITLFHHLDFGCSPLNLRSWFNDVFTWLWTNAAGTFSVQRVLILFKGHYLQPGKMIRVGVTAQWLQCSLFWNQSQCCKFPCLLLIPCTSISKVRSFHSDQKSLGLMLTLVNPEERLLLD